MMIIMAEKALETGTNIRCKTCYGKELVGVVAGWDCSKKALILVCPAVNQEDGQSKNDVHMINMAFLKELDVVQEAQIDQEPTYAPLDLNKLTRRVKDNQRAKLAKVNNIGVGVTAEGQELFDSIKKTMEDVKWDGKTIVVLGDVNIVEPYTEKELQLRSGKNANTLNHLRKVVQKHYADKSQS